MTRPRMTLAVTVALFLRWLATGHLTATIGRTPVTMPAFGVAAAVVTLTGLAAAAAAVLTTRTAWPLPADNPDRSPGPMTVTRTPAITARVPHGTGRGPGSHLCPANGCRQPVSPDRLMCRPHWYTVPKPLRDAVWTTWQSGAGAGTAAHTAAILAAIDAATTTGGPR